ncbi:MAG: hypothetical protein H0X24_10585 [Ktedonobacterales bacterium]|nr:hypothetical protein [Ktedonobacterales bacterium]
MIIHIATADNAFVLPTPVLDDTEKGYHLEDRMQVTVRSPANDKTATVEFRLDAESDAPTLAQLDAWIESGDLLRVVCSGVTARPFIHQEGKQYRSRGSEKEINGQTATLDTLIIFAGQSITLASEPFDADEEVRRARGAYKKAQRSYRQRTNAERLARTNAGMEERIAKMREAAKAKEAAAAAASPAAPATDGTGQNGRRRS